ncbi:hypothetical protein CDAR_438121 [Caerostris darwini]|uniref:Transmembrane protein n=1 Tax=Caerostris darwini TaxID=1538125 RepID=A0AAV4TSX3_9ARAC|nr:hypothetical protein CDAR_438121 [Caerostris darwini]
MKIVPEQRSALICFPNQNYFTWSRTHGHKLFFLNKLLYDFFPPFSLVLLLSSCTLVCFVVHAVNVIESTRSLLPSRNEAVIFKTRERVFPEEVLDREEKQRQQ